MTLDEWAARWRLPPECVTEFLALTGRSISSGSESERAVQSRVRLEAAQKGVHLWRNNVGAGQLANGSFLRWGLANDSAGLNEVIKSADLIGIRKRLITPADVGQHLGQFVSREVKRADWHWTGTPEEEAQLRWATLILSHGGDAAIVNSTGSI